MATNSSNIVFDDIFTINAIDKEGKKFDRGMLGVRHLKSCFYRLCLVSRLYAHSKNYDMDLTLDYNVELFPLKTDQSFALALASSLARGPPVTGGVEDEEKDSDVWRPDGKGRRGLEEDYDYVMYGKVSNSQFSSSHIPKYHHGIAGSHYAQGIQV
jgi:DNA-directed RNA polymerases I, II, and III subunit RPABC3